LPCGWRFVVPWLRRCVSDVADLRRVGGEIYDSCSNCRREYLDAIVNAKK
jgi:hypothetical protein